MALPQPTSWRPAASQQAPADQQVSGRQWEFICQQTPVAQFPDGSTGFSPSVPQGLLTADYLSANGQQPGDPGEYDMPREAKKTKDQNLTGTE